MTDETNEAEVKAIAEAVLDALVEDFKRRFELASVATYAAPLREVSLNMAYALAQRDRSLISEVQAQASLVFARAKVHVTKEAKSWLDNALAMLWDFSLSYVFRLPLA